jgi:hypothetical protein
MFVRVDSDSMSEISEPSNNRPKEKDASHDKLLRGSDVNTISDELEKKLTPEEQMALYEKELKENDWGHQPC